MTLFARILIFCCTILPITSYAQGLQLPPVDEAAEHPSFFAFRARLLEALAVRDTTFLYAHVDPYVLNSFGGNGGLEEFKTTWSIEEADSPLWRTLTSILAMGGAFGQDGPDLAFYAPYYTALWPDSLDAFEHGLILGENVRVRMNASLDADILATLSYEIVRLNRDADESRGLDPDSWRAIELEDGRTGYVAADYLRSPIGMRAGFRRVDGTWYLVHLLAGD